MKTIARPLLLLLTLLCITSAGADEREVIFDELSLSASAEAEVDNDRVRAVLFAEREGSDPAELARIVNREMEWALGRLAGAVGIEVSTPSYQTLPVYHQGRVDSWRVRQSLRLESGDYVAISRVVGELQKRLGLESMQFYLSEQGRQDAEDALIPEALKRYTARAKLMARQLGRKGYRIVAVSVGSGGTPVPRRAELMMRASSAPPPQMAAGSSKVRVTVSGSIQLRD